MGTDLKKIKIIIIIYLEPAVFVFFEQSTVALLNSGGIAEFDSKLQTN